MRGRCWTAFLYGLSTTTAFTRIRRSGIVHRVSSLPHINRDDLSDLSGATTGDWRRGMLKHYRNKFVAHRAEPDPDKRIP
jgi:hypothetical protein